jgi:hypothetical protein
MRTGGIGGSLFLIALGAILYWAVSVEGEGFDINMIGLILLIVGIIGLVLTLIMTASAEENTGQTDVTIVDRSVLTVPARICVTGRNGFQHRPGPSASRHSGFLV